MAALLASPYRLRFGHLGRRPRILPPLLLAGARRIYVGDDTRIEAYVALSVVAEGRIDIGSNCELRSFARLESDIGSIVLGDRCSVNPYSMLSGYGGLHIGNDVRIASHCVVLSSTHNFEDVGVAIQTQGVEGRATHIEDDVWIGSHAVIVGGVRVGAHSVIGAGAIVLSDIPPYSIAAGVPARVLKTRTPSV